MPYKRTGKPPGRPRKNKPEPVKPLTRARQGFRRAFADPAEQLHQPPRMGSRRKQRGAGKRPVLHPNVIAGLANG